jgi:hypothetical protein
MFFVLQPGGNFMQTLEEGLVTIKDGNTCNDSYPGFNNDIMICAGMDSGHMGPCNVRSL